MLDKGDPDPVRPGPRFKPKAPAHHSPPLPQEQLASFIEFSGHRASALHAIGFQRNWAKALRLN